MLVLNWSWVMPYYMICQQVLHISSKNGQVQFADDHQYKTNFAKLAVSCIPCSGCVCVPVFITTADLFRSVTQPVEHMLLYCTQCLRLTSLVHQKRHRVPSWIAYPDYCQEIVTGLVHCLLEINFRSRCAYYTSLNLKRWWYAVFDRFAVARYFHHFPCGWRL